MNTAHDFTRLFDILPFQMSKYPQDVALAGRWHGHWKTYSTSECLGVIEKLSLGLLSYSLKPGEKVATIFHTGCPEWNLVDYSLQQIGLVVVPLHATASPADISHIITDAEIQLAFCSNLEMVTKLRKAAELANIEIQIFSIDEIEGQKNWTELHKEPSDQELNLIEKRKVEISPDDIATILYTSGTTGTPKGVVLTHKNIVSNIKSILTLVPLSHEKTALSFLPISHIFERMVCYLYMATGTSIWYSSEMSRAFIDIREVKPHFITAVPRVLEKVYNKILEAIHQRSGLGRKVLKWAIRFGLNYDPLEKLSPLYWFRFQIINLLVYRQWRKLLGGRIEGIVVGAASLQPKLARLFCAAGLPVREGYGLTETSPVVSFNHFNPGLYRFGTVGIPLPGVDVKISEPDGTGEGEVLVKGPNVMKGYHNRLEETKSVLSDDGWLRTGDIGKFVEKRFLKITDRKSDIFKTSSGKFVAPQKVESVLNSSSFIQQSMVFGLNQPYPAALIVPHFDALEKWCQDNGVHWTGPQFMVLNPKVVEFMNGVVNELNQELEAHERIGSFTLLHEEWTMESGELTFTMKLSRRTLAVKFSKEINNLFNS